MRVVEALDMRAVVAADAGRPRGKHARLAGRVGLEPLVVSAVSGASALAVACAVRLSSQVGVEALVDLEHHLPYGVAPSGGAQEGRSGGPIRRGSGYDQERIRRGSGYDPERIRRAINKAAA